MSSTPGPARGRALGYALVAGSAASWGSWSLMLRPAERLGPLAPELVAMLVQAMTAVVSVPLALRARPGTARDGRAWGLLAALALSNAINMWLFFKAMALTTVAVAVLTHSLAPLLVAAFAPWVTGEPSSRRTWACLLVALAGLTLLLEPWATPARGLVAGASAGGASAVFYAFNVLGQKRLGPRFHPAETVGYQAIVATVLLGALVPAGGWSLVAGQVPLVALAALVPGAIASLTFVAGLRMLPASHTATLVLLEPLVAVLLGVIVWREPLGAAGALGGVLMLGSLVASVQTGRPGMNAEAGEQ
ncbi:MAG: DMT family transporter [Myxococcales bacterium]|nr:MAG: DMT family transporter [Myxococcales bacterium]